MIWEIFKKKGKLESGLENILRMMNTIPYKKYQSRT